MEKAMKTEDEIRDEALDEAAKLADVIEKKRYALGEMKEASLAGTIAGQIRALKSPPVTEGEKL